MLVNVTLESVVLVKCMRTNSRHAVACISNSRAVTGLLVVSNERYDCSTTHRQLYCGINYITFLMAEEKEDRLQRPANVLLMRRNLRLLICSWM